MLSALITSKIEAHLDRSMYNALASQEETEREQLARVADNWEAVSRLADDMFGDE